MKEIPQNHEVLQHPLVAQYKRWWDEEVVLQQSLVRKLSLPAEEIERRLGLIDLKINHIVDCFQAAYDIASRMDNAKAKVIGGLVAFAHDLARPEQGGQKGGYSDKITAFAHALEGTKKLMLLNGHMEREYDIDPYAILEAVLFHSDKDYEGDNFAAKFARDMDKLALLREHATLVENAMINSKLRHEPPTQKIIDIYNSGALIPSHEIETLGDMLLLYSAWKNGVHFEETRQIIEDENLIPTILSSYRYTRDLHLN